MGFFERLFYSLGIMLAAWRKPELFIALGLHEAANQSKKEEDPFGDEPAEPWDKFR